MKENEKSNKLNDLKSQIESNYKSINDKGSENNESDLEKLEKQRLELLKKFEELLYDENFLQNYLKSLVEKHVGHEYEYRRFLYCELHKWIFEYKPKFYINGYFELSERIDFVRNYLFECMEIYENYHKVYSANSNLKELTRYFIEMADLYKEASLNYIGDNYYNDRLLFNISSKYCRQFKEETLMKIRDSELLTSDEINNENQTLNQNIQDTKNNFKHFEYIKEENKYKFISSGKLLAAAIIQKYKDKANQTIITNLYRTGLFEFNVKIDSIKEYISKREPHGINSEYLKKHSFTLKNIFEEINIILTDNGQKNI